MSVFGSIQRVTGTPYNQITYNGDILDQFFLRRARDQGVRLPTAATRDPEEWWYHGAFVATPVAGLHHDVVYMDLASLYPNTIRALNIGPDTLIGTEDALEDSRYTEEDCLHSFVDPRPVKHVTPGTTWQQYTDGTYKAVYDDEKTVIRWRDDPEFVPCYYLHPDVRESFVREAVQELIAMKYEFEDDFGLYEAVKRIVNSVYGAMSELREDYAARFADWRIGESVTLAGRKIIQETGRVTEEFVENERGYDAYRVGGDTDAVALSIEATTRTEVCNAASAAAEYLNDEHYPTFMADTFGCNPEEGYMEVEVESYSPSMFIPAAEPDDPDDDSGVKKRYMEWITVEDVDTDATEVDEIDITGLEHQRSDVADVTREAQEHFAECLLRDGVGKIKSEHFPYLRELHESIIAGDIAPERVAKRGGIGQDLDEYGSENRRPGPIYRGAKYANQNLDVHLGVGSKPQVYYIDQITGNLPNTYTAETPEDGDVVDAISVEDPDDLPVDKIRLDWEKHAAKSLTDPMRPLLRTLNFDWEGVLDGTEQGDLLAYA